LKTDTATHLHNWLESIDIHDYQLLPLTGDASLRRYFRVHAHGNTYILMDTSKEIHYFDPFVEYTRILANQNIPVPKIYAGDAALGVLLLSDFGDILLLDKLNQTNADSYYKTAIDTLIDMQRCRHFNDVCVPLYDEHTYRQEIELFRTWYIPYFLHTSLTSKEEQILNGTFDLLIEDILFHPQIFVHRDYHSRNLMCLDNEQLGVIDYQDGCFGSIVYDIVSLLKDCYIQWSCDQVSHWLHYFYRQWGGKYILSQVDFTTFRQWFDWAGLQRHLKCLGIFVRLKHQQNKTYHIQHLPRIQSYIQAVVSRYPIFCEFNQLLTALHRRSMQ
jgi:aminoglycoside/choline kinase family phosphotransferase